MIEFSKQISEQWSIPADAAEQVCQAYLKGDSPYYLGEYHPIICTELSILQICEIFDFLKEMEELSSKKKRVLNAFKKVRSISPELERRINLTTNPFELDDLFITVRPNPRSRGQIAAGKGIKPLAERILAQQDETVTVEQMAVSYVGKDPSLKSTDDVIAAVKDIMAEMIAYDETVRAMAREFAFEDGFFEIIIKNKNDTEFSEYVGRSIPVGELSYEEVLRLADAEEKKRIRIKLGVQLFRITELLRHHFIINPSSTAFDIICETIDESWMRLLQPGIERDVKIRVIEQARAWALRQLREHFEKVFEEELHRGSVIVVDGAAAAKQILFLAVNGKGELLGTTTERKPAEGKNFISERLRQFVGRYRPEKIVVIENEGAESVEALLYPIFTSWDKPPEIIKFTPTVASGAEDVKVNEWIREEYEALLDERMQKLYNYALLFLKPISLLPNVGIDFYTVHPFQTLLPKHKVCEIVERIRTSARLKEGIPIKEITDFTFNQMPSITPALIQAIKSADTEGIINKKNDLLKVAGMTEVAFRNIAGFVVISAADTLLDRTTVHPDYFDWFNEIAQQLNVSIDTLVTEPEYLRSYVTDDIRKKIIIEKKIIHQLTAGRRFVVQQPTKIRRKLKLTELKEGAVVSGKVTNITPFGVFVNINAVCDGLIHISQLADEYIESPDQVVSVNERVDVRILKVDVKKRRISLSMRNVGTRAPKVRPSRGQLNNLAEHFKNR